MQDIREMYMFKALLQILIRHFFKLLHFYTAVIEEKTNVEKYINIRITMLKTAKQRAFSIYAAFCAVFFFCRVFQFFKSKFNCCWLSRPWTRASTRNSAFDIFFTTDPSMNCSRTNKIKNKHEILCYPLPVFRR